MLVLPSSSPWHICDWLICTPSYLLLTYLDLHHCTHCLILLPLLCDHCSSYYWLTLLKRCSRHCYCGPLQCVLLLCWSDIYIRSVLTFPTPEARCSDAQAVHWIVLVRLDSWSPRVRSLVCAALQLWNQEFPGRQQVTFYSTRHRQSVCWLLRSTRVVDYIR